jgi:Ni,Fe-hydrogenase III small subunit
MGMQTVWVNRGGSNGWVDCLGTLTGCDSSPTIIVKGVDEAVERIQQDAKGERGNKL